MFGWIKRLFGPRPIDTAKLDAWREMRVAIRSALHNRRLALIDLRAKAVRQHKSVAGIDRDLNAVMRQIMERK